MSQNRVLARVWHICYSIDFKYLTSLLKIGSEGNAVKLNHKENTQSNGYSVFNFY